MYLPLFSLRIAPLWLPSSGSASIFLSCVFLSYSTPCKWHILTSEIQGPSHPVRLCPECQDTQCCITVWNFHASANSPCTWIKFLFSPVTLSLFIWLLAELEHLQRWKRKYYFLAPTPARMIPVEEHSTLLWMSEEASGGNVFKQQCHHCLNMDMDMALNPTSFLSASPNWFLKNLSLPQANVSRTVSSVSKE